MNVDVGNKFVWKGISFVALPALDPFCNNVCLGCYFINKPLCDEVTKEYNCVPNAVVFVEDFGTGAWFVC